MVELLQDGVMVNSFLTLGPLFVKLTGVTVFTTALTLSAL
jgi:hypothetical protein